MYQPNEKESTLCQHLQIEYSGNGLIGVKHPWQQLDIQNKDDVDIFRTNG